LCVKIDRGSCGYMSVTTEIKISGATFSGLWSALNSCGGSGDVLLFGTRTTHTTVKNTDQNEQHKKVTTVIRTFNALAGPCSFYSVQGDVDSSKLTASIKRYPQEIFLGWCTFRRNSPLRKPTNRESAVFRSLKQIYPSYLKNVGG